ARGHPPLATLSGICLHAPGAAGRPGIGVQHGTAWGVFDSATHEPDRRRRRSWHLARSRTGFLVRRAEPASPDAGRTRCRLEHGRGGSLDYPSHRSAGRRQPCGDLSHFPGRRCVDSWYGRQTPGLAAPVVRLRAGGRWPDTYRHALGFGGQPARHGADLPTAVARHPGPSFPANRQPAGPSGPWRISDLGRAEPGHRLPGHRRTDGGRFDDVAGCRFTILEPSFAGSDGSRGAVWMCVGVARTAVVIPLLATQRAGHRAGGGRVVSAVRSVRSGARFAASPAFTHIPM
ncbi:Zinc ABC transporter, permease protein ZnuB, partial [Pseudomonas sp. FG-3G]